MRWTLAIACLLGSDLALADALDSWPVWSAAQPYTSKQVPPSVLVMRGEGTDAYYVVEIDPTTGALPIDASGASISIDYSGTPGAAVPAKAGYVGGTDGTNLRGIKTDSSGELQVDVLSSTLPSGAATSAKQDLQATAANQTTANTSLSTLAGTVSAGNVNVAVQTLPIQTDAGAVSSTTQRVTEAARSYSDSARNDYSSASVTTGAWVQVDASTAANINYLCMTDQSGQIMELGTGAVASETRVFLIPRGFSGCVPLRIASGTRLSLRAVSATANSGDFTYNGML